MNVHMVIHITSCVRNWGPLWCYSCFQFESMNKELKKLFRGTRYMSKQVGCKLCMACIALHNNTVGSRVIVSYDWTNCILCWSIQMAFSFVMQQVLPTVRLQMQSAIQVSGRERKRRWGYTQALYYLHEWRRAISFCSTIVMRTH